MIRVSTDTQKLDDQHNEMVTFCKEEGYDDLIFVEDKGASAIKLNESYQLMIAQVKEEIEKDKDIRCFAVWELSRAFRNEGVYYEIKSFLLKHKIQFICKNPYLKMLNPDGSLNTGMEIAMSLLATLAKQEMELKKERFKRAKKAMREQGKFVGGVVKFGYKVEKGRFLAIDEGIAPQIRLIFELYSSGSFSVRTLWQEMKERGYDISYHNINKIIADRTYVDGRYPQIVSEDLWKRCEEVRKKNFLSIPKGRKHCFGSGIFKCGICGRNMIAEGVQYRCWHHNKYAAPPHCENTLTIRVDNLDGLLWWIASKEEITYRMKLDGNRKEEYEKKIEVLKEKLESTKKRLKKEEEKKKRIVDSYIEGIIEKGEMEKRLIFAKEETKRYKDTILSLNEKIEGFLGVILGGFEEEVDLEKLKSIYLGVIKEENLEIMDGIVKKHIRKVTSSAEWFGKDRDLRAVRQNAQLIVVETVYSGVKKFIYVARKYKGHRFFYYREDGKESPLYDVHPIKRESLGKKHPNAFKKLKDW